MTTEAEDMELREYRHLMNRLVMYVKLCTEARGPLPNLSYLAKRYRVRQDTILQIAEDAEDITVNVGLATANGYIELAKREYTLEYLGE